MKIFKKILLILFLCLTIFISVMAYINLPKLNIITGYSAKMMNSSVFVAHRDADFTDSTDVNMNLIRLANDEVDFKTKSTEATVYGLKNRKAVYREGLGSVLINEKYDADKVFPKPKRSRITDTIPFPYGNGEPKDSIFENIDYQSLNRAIEKTFDSVSKTRSVLVAYNDHIVAEKNAAGFNEKSLHLGWSMTKSLLGAFYGVLSYQGKIDIHNKIPVKEWKNDERAQITLNNLLQMSSGLEWDEDYTKISDATKMLFLESDMSRSQLLKPLIHKPDEVFYYSSGTTNLLSGILRKQFSTHKAYLDFIYTDFIDKIGMNSVLLEADMAGNYVASSYAWATTRDWAKLGLVYLHKGNWNGTQVFAPEWVDYSTTPAKSSNGRYGAHIWLNQNEYYPDLPKDIYSANGFQGQRVFVFPSHNLVVVRMGLAKIDFNIFLKEILDAID